ncbi:NAD(P)-dependent oxidoreductase [Paenibacillus alkalitolerans]|uniref:NAD(P)-dependent oxidoreductase n=1 Tax=Paenibacillus alkalitolerans TaxID=2799335 RepID=UPI0018F6F0B0|nr:NAD(P)-dependent oxidoreductase [Paenibacillus alkalitolerans]
MTRPKVFISHRMPEAGIRLIEDYCDIDYYGGTEPLSKEDFVARAREADAVLAFVCDFVDEDIVRSISNVRVISSFGKGYDNIDVDACTRHNVLVTVNPDALTDSTADLAIGLLLAVSRNILPGDRHVRSGKFAGWHATNCLGRDFHHSAIGIVGLGVIGQAVARRAAGFGVSILYHDIRRKPDWEEAGKVHYMELVDLMKESDFILVAVDLRPESVHLIDEAALRFVKPGAYLVNVSRGSIVDEAAVARALKEDRLAGYAADVFEFEDRAVPERNVSIPDELLQETDRTVFTPHIGTGTVQARERLAVSSANQLLAALRGEIPTGAVNSVRVPRMI